MSSRKKPDQRCPRCLMRVGLCLCALIPTLVISTKVIVVIAHREILVPTNTGRLAAQALPNSAILIHGANGPDAAACDLMPHLRPGRQALLLYPGDDAELLTPDVVQRFGGMVDLVVPDGNWRKTSKMRRRIPGMLGLPTVRLAPGGPSAYRVRKETKAEGLATIEAIARALGVIEGDAGPAVQAALEQLMATMVERTMTSRGL